MDGPKGGRLGADDNPRRNKMAGCTLFVFVAVSSEMQDIESEDIAYTERFISDLEQGYP